VGKRCLRWKMMLIHISNNSSLIIQLDSAPVHFAYIVREHLNVNFPGRWIERGESIAWSPFILLNLCIWTFFFVAVWMTGVCAE
jgi:hypothetical protein